MSQDRKADDKKLDFELDPSPKDLIKYYQLANSIPLIHLAKQFVNPGIPDVKNQDAKDSKDRQIDLEDLTPNLTREEAFSRFTIREVVTEKDQRQFTIRINELLLKLQENKISEFERIIIVLAYRFGLGVEFNPSKAFQLLNVQQLKNNGYGFYLLGNAYRYGYGIAKDNDEALHYYNLAINKGIGSGYFGKGNMFYEGDFLKKNLDKSFLCYQSGAEKNCAFSLLRLGDCYAEGEGIQKDLKRAADFYSKSIKQGCNLAMNSYAVSFLSANRQEQLLFFQIAANIGFSAHYARNAGHILENGVEPKDIPQAAYYYRLAHLRDANFNEIENIFKNNLTNFEVVYHHAMATNDQKALQGALLNDPVSFNRLWCKDIDSKISEIKEQALKCGIELVQSGHKKLFEEASPRLKANVAIHYFQQNNFDQGLQYTNGLGTKQLSAEENFKVGFFLYTLSLQYHALNKHGLQDGKDTLIDESFKSKPQNDLRQQAEMFLMEAKNQGQVEAGSLLLRMKAENIISPTSYLGYFSVLVTKDMKSSVNNTAAGVLSLDDDENIIDHKSDLPKKN